MAKRKIITIDEKKCNGCGLCIPNCPEGAIQIIDQKARLISDLFCDGLGACIGHCPQGAISIEEREAVAYDEKKVMSNIVKQGKNTIKAHLLHLKEHNEHKYLQLALDYLREQKIENPLLAEAPAVLKNEHALGGCPGSRAFDFRQPPVQAQGEQTGKRPSELRQWPLQLHLISPQASYYQKADLLLAADCTAFTLGDFHKDYLKGKALAIACPKLDQDKDVYVEKLIALIDEALINTLTVIIMQVPCCGGLVAIAQQALDQAKRKIPIKTVIVSLQGEILSAEWVTAK
jgi:NAD-dependent dihydropyrimidine dehydrogenase PreA subunit